MRAVTQKLLAAVLFAATASGQMVLSLSEASARTGPDLVPKYQNQEITVRGTVSTASIAILDYTHIAIQDENQYGLLLKGGTEGFRQLTPGENIEATGIIVKHAGMPVLAPRTIRVVSKGSPPEPKNLKFQELLGFRHLGTLVNFDAHISNAGENSGGEFLFAGNNDNALKLFLPSASSLGGDSLKKYRSGDKLRVTGIAMQYCPLPPHDKLFQVLLASAGDVRLLERSWIVSPGYLLTGLGILLASVGVLYFREKRMQTQRESMRQIHALSEDIINAETSGEILAKLSSSLPRIQSVDRVSLFIFNKAARTLDRVSVDGGPPLSVAIDAPRGTLLSGVAFCYRNRTMLAIPDIRRSPLFDVARIDDPPRSVLLVPGFAQHELLAVIQMENRTRARVFTSEEQASAQHLANLVAASLRLQEQQSVREQLFRSEKLAASGQLISGVISELRAPIETIATLASKLLSHRGEDDEEELEAVALETLSASEIVSRLMSLVCADETAAQPVDLRQLLPALIEGREREHQLGGIELRQDFTPQKLIVLGSASQLEQVFFNLLLHAEKSVRESAERQIHITARHRGKSVTVEIVFSGDPEHVDPFEDRTQREGGPMALGVCRGIVQAHGGTIHLTRSTLGGSRFEVDLPVPRAAQPPPSRPRPQSPVPARQLTALVVEPDSETNRRLVTWLSTRGHRAVTEAHGEDGVDLVLHFSFDLVLCSVSLNGPNWVEFFQRVRHHVGAFVLLTEAYDSDLSRAFEGSAGYVLRKPIQEPEFERIVAVIEDLVESQEVSGNA